MDARHDYIYENDVALGRLIDWLEATPDPRRAGRKLIENTLVIFTSDNGAEKTAISPPGRFAVTKAAAMRAGIGCRSLRRGRGGVGDGRADTPGQSNDSIIGLTDMYATFAEMAGPLCRSILRRQGAEDSVSVLPALR